MKNPIETGELIPITTHGSCYVVAAGPLTKQPNSMPYRIVLLQWPDGKYSVHDQIYSDLGNLVDPDVTLLAELGATPNKPPRASLAHGHYFKAGAEGLTDATLKFAHKIQSHAPMVETIYREPALVS